FCINNFSRVVNAWNKLPTEVNKLIIKQLSGFREHRQTRDGNLKFMLNIFCIEACLLYKSKIVKDLTLHLVGPLIKVDKKNAINNSFKTKNIEVIKGAKNPKTIYKLNMLIKLIVTQLKKSLETERSLRLLNIIDKL
ncbi:hypothetical protein BpHYR1_006401, partial [Brachionus plicatilis]